MPGELLKALQSSDYRAEGPVNIRVSLAEGRLFDLSELCQGFYAFILAPLADFDLISVSKDKFVQHLYSCRFTNGTGTSSVRFQLQ